MRAFLYHVEFNHITCDQACKVDDSNGETEDEDDGEEPQPDPPAPLPLQQPSARLRSRSRSPLPRCHSASACGSQQAPPPEGQADLLKRLKRIEVKVDRILRHLSDDVRP